MRIIGVSLLIMVSCAIAEAQVLTLDECYQLAEQNYPLAKQKDLISKTRDYTIEQAQKGYLPQVSIIGQATYQSDVTGIPITFPGIDIPTLSKDQYKVYGEVNQVIYDAGAIRKQKEMQKANAEIESQNVEVELYKLKERINQLYFGVLLIDRQLDLIGIRESNIQSGLHKVNGAIANGTAFKANADILKAELVTAEQSRIEQRAMRRSYLDMLGIFINKPLNDSIKIENPSVQNDPLSEIKRPELIAFDFRKKMLDLNEEMISVKNQPKVSLFVQGGYGKPGLNMLKNDFALYGIGGIRFNWLLSGFYTAKQERLVLDNQRKSIDVQRETFLFNTNLAQKQDQSELTKLQELIKTDRDLIALRTNIKNTTSAQLENGVKMPDDFVRDVNAENQARQNLALHEIQLVYSYYRLKTTLGN